VAERTDVSHLPAVELINGILLGGLYATVALGLTLVFGVMRLVNLAHGEMLVGAAYLSYFFSSQLGLDPLVSLALVAPAVALVAYPVQRVLLNPLVSYGLEPPLVATFGLSIVAQTVFVLTFTSDAHSLNASYAVTGIRVLGEQVPQVYVIALGVGVALVVLLHFGLTRLRFGKALRAAAEDPEAAATMGIDVRHVYAATFAIAAALAAVGGVFIGVAFSITPTTGLDWLLRAFTVIVLGGMGSVGGTLAGGVVVGVAEQLGATWFGPQYHDLVVFSLLVIVLVLRPQGLFGKKLA
jgi:branched-chain amino acid transport system permease protein